MHARASVSVHTCACVHTYVCVLVRLCADGGDIHGQSHRDGAQAACGAPLVCVWDAHQPWFGGLVWPGGLLGRAPLGQPHVVEQVRGGGGRKGPGPGAQSPTLHFTVGFGTGAGW